MYIQSQHVCIFHIPPLTITTHPHYHHHHHHIMHHIRVQQQMMWLLDLMVSNPKSKMRVHISEKCVRFIGLCINTRKEKIERAGMSVRVSVLVSVMNVV